MQVPTILALGLSSLALATPQFGPVGFGGHGGLGHHGAPVHHAPVHHAPVRHGPVHHQPEYGPRPFAYEYGVQDSYSGSDFAKKEVQAADGVVTGEYRVALPDGRIQIVTYTADDYNGYVADVRYEGAAVYPTAPHHGGPPHGGALHHGGPGPAHGFHG